MERNVLKERLMNKDDKNRHCVLLIIDISKQGRKKWVMSKWQDPVSWMIVILQHIIAYFSINIRWHSQNVSSDSRKWLIKHLFPPRSCKKQINKQNYYLLLALLQSGSVPELDMHVSKHFLPGQFIHSGYCSIVNIYLIQMSLVNPPSIFT